MNAAVVAVTAVVVDASDPIRIAEAGGRPHVSQRSECLGVLADEPPHRFREVAAESEGGGHTLVENGLERLTAGLADDDGRDAEPRQIAAHFEDVVALIVDHDDAEGARGLCGSHLLAEIAGPPIDEGDGRPLCPEGDGRFVTSRQIKERLEREVLGNVSIRIGSTSSPEIIEVAGRGELQLAVLIESMRREGYELQVSRPEVIIREIEGKPHEPLERAVVDVPNDHVGTITQAVAPRKGQVTDLRPGDAGRTIVTLTAPARGLLGFRSLLMTATRGTALVHQHHAGWMPWAGELPHRQGGAMAADRIGTSTGFALDNLQKRGELFIGPNTDVYEGMIIGEASRPEDMQVNPTKTKQLTNIRTHSTDEAIKLKPAKEMTLELAIEWIAEDELVEVTPSAIRVRKRFLTESERKRQKKL